jgi:hypothetical protein
VDKVRKGDLSIFLYNEFLHIEVAGIRSIHHFVLVGRDKPTNYGLVRLNFFVDQFYLLNGCLTIEKDVVDLARILWVMGLQGRVPWGTYLRSRSSSGTGKSGGIFWWSFGLKNIVSFFSDSETVESWRKWVSHVVVPTYYVWIYIINYHVQTKECNSNSRIIAKVTSEEIYLNNKETKL